MAGQGARSIDGPATGEERETADWWPRGAALAIDVAFAAAVFLAVFVIVAMVLFFGGALLGIDALFEEEDYFIVPWPAFRIAAVIALLAALAVAPFTMVRTGGRSVGKVALKLRVVEVNGAAPGWGRALVRDGWLRPLILALGLVTFAIVPLVDMLWPLWQRDRRALHDLVCGTRVIRAA